MAFPLAEIINVRRQIKVIAVIQEPDEIRCILRLVPTDHFPYHLLLVLFKLNDKSCPLVSFNFYRSTQLGCQDTDQSQTETAGGFAVYRVWNPDTIILECNGNP